METNKIVSWLFGAIGGTWYYIFITPVVVRIVEAGVTAFVCGFLGVSAKWAFDLLKKKIESKYFKK